ncbi:MAG: AAA family ATPase [Vampirovibrionales bacterium]
MSLSLPPHTYTRETLPALEAFPQFVLLTGKNGVGKTTLLNHWAEQHDGVVHGMAPFFDTENRTADERALEAVMDAPNGLDEFHACWQEAFPLSQPFSFDDEPTDYTIGEYRLACLLARLLYTPAGTLWVVDEIELGLHHSHAFPVLDHLFEHAHKHGCRLVITTHSDDWVKAWLNLHHRQEQLKKEAKKQKERGSKSKILTYHSGVFNVVRLATAPKYLRLQPFCIESLMVLRHNHSEFRV